MFGKTPHLGPLESRKRLLIAESELNRAQMAEEWRTMTAGAAELGQRARTLAAWVSTAALLVAGVMAARRGPASAPGAKSAWLDRILQWARVISTLWPTGRAQGAPEEDQ